MKAPFDTFFSILILAIHFALAMPRYTETISPQVSMTRTSLEASATAVIAHCGYGGWPHSCWKYCGATGEWCWIQPNIYCQSDYDCDYNSLCASRCGRGIQSQEFMALEAPRAHDHLGVTQGTIEEPVTNVVEGVTCGRGKKVEDGNPRISVKLLIE